MRRDLLVSIHDVTPALAAPVRELWDLCQRHGVTPALLVVPDWHGAWPIEQHPAFMHWVRDCANAGAEIFLHGERHDEVGLPRDVMATLRAVGRTAREGEFLTLDARAAGERIARGLQRLAAQHLTPIGFIPPAWLARSSMHDVVRAAGLAVSEDHGHVLLHRRRRVLPAPALRWSGRTSWRAYASAQVSRWRWHAWQRRPLVRLALHPQDLDHAVTRVSLMHELDRWTRARTVVRYAEL
jgi:uncharacterized protein